MSKYDICDRIPYSPGEIVHIRSYIWNPPGWYSDMDRYIGQAATIISRQEWSMGIYVYKLGIDGGKNLWSSGCFKESYGRPLPELSDMPSSPGYIKRGHWY